MADDDKGKSEKDFKEMWRFMGPRTRNFVATLGALGAVMIALGLNFSGPMNRIANAIAMKWEIEAEMLRVNRAVVMRPNSNVLLMLNDMEARIVALEHLSHEPTPQ